MGINDNEAAFEFTHIISFNSRPRLIQSIKNVQLWRCGNLSLNKTISQKLSKDP